MKYTGRIAVNGCTDFYKQETKEFSNKKKAISWAINRSKFWCLPGKTGEWDVLDDSWTVIAAGTSHYNGCFVRYL